MFGKAGLPRMADIAHKLSGLWKKKHKFVLGVFCRHPVIYAVRLENKNEQWELYDNIMVPIQVIGDEDEAYPPETVVEKVAAMMQVMGWSASPVAMCLSEDYVFIDTLHLPDMPENEMHEAVHWELDSQRDFLETEFLSMFMQKPDGEGQWAAAVPQYLVDIWSKAWKDNGLEMAAITVMPSFMKESCNVEEAGLQLGEVYVPSRHEPYDVFFNDGGWEALYAATTLCCIEYGCLNFLMAGKLPKSDWNWKSLSATVTAVVVIGLFGCLMSDYGQLYSEQEQLSEQKSQLALLSHAQKEKQLLERATDQIKEKKSHLVRLSEESYPWRSIFVHLGTMTVEGVWLNEITMPKPNLLEIHGDAIQYDALAEFLQKFEGDRDFFPEAPILKSSNVDSNAGHEPTVSFQLTLNLVHGDDANGKAG